MRICIAGVNQGLGLVLSRLMAQKGHTVYAGFRGKASADVEGAAKQFAGFKPLALDVTDETAAHSAAKLIAAEGTLDAVIVVAGVLVQSDRELLITDTNIDDLRAALEVNVVGSAIMIKHFHSVVKNGGMFIVVTSEAGSVTNNGAKYPGYSISKAGQNKLTAVFAQTVSKYRVYAVHPGRMNTVMGRNDAQIEPEESAEGIYKIVSGEKKIPAENGWFINYRGEAMAI